MKPRQIDAVQVCKEFEDVLVPRLKLSVLERAIYSHLFRHTASWASLVFAFRFCGSPTIWALGAEACARRCAG